MNGHAELEGCENEGNSANDLGMTAGSWVVFENETGVDVDRERIADSDGSRVEAAIRKRKLLLTSPVVHWLTKRIQMAAARRLCI